MGKTCAICRGRPKLRCDRCRNEFCGLHAIKCHSCGTITCVRDLGRRAQCPVCKKPLPICPECLLNGEIVRTISDPPVCPECGWTAT